MPDLEVFNSDYTAEQIENEIEHSVPRINSTNKHWERWDITNQAWVDTGVVAEGSTTISVNGILKGSNGTIVQAVEGTDYPSVASVNAKYTKPASGIPNSDIASASIWNGKQNAPTFTTSSINTTSWTNKVYTGFQTLYPFASYDIEVSISPSATDSERDAYASAMFTGASDSNNITALGDKPSIAIPVILKVWAK